MNQGKHHFQRVMPIVVSFVMLALLLVAAATQLDAQPLAAASTATTTPDAIEQLRNLGARVTVDDVTGVARFVRADVGIGTLSADNSTASIQTRANTFLSEYGLAFGLTNSSAQLALTNATSDSSYNTSRLAYKQMHNGVPVYGSYLYLHFGAGGQFVGANGVTVPDISIGTTPALSADEAEAALLATFDHERGLLDSAENPPPPHLNVTASTLVVYRQGLIAGVAGLDTLAYELTVVGNHFRELIYVDANRGNIIERINLIHDTLSRKVYDGGYGPAFLVWEEGDPFPYTGGSATQTLNINRILTSTQDVYNLFYAVSGGSYSSYDGADVLMEIVNNDPAINCPNANWNGTSTNYCNGVTGDDTVAHEWTHAYTEFTHGLIYSMQPGALNESYSDIFGEIVDVINQEGFDAPDVPRTAGSCSVYGGSAPDQLLINSPSAIAGNLQMGIGGWNASSLNVTASVVAATDGDDEAGVASVTDACQPLTNAAAISGNIALIDRGSCTFSVKAANAQAAGAVGMIVVNNVTPGFINMTGTGSIPGVMISQADGQTIKDNLPVSASILTAGAGVDPSVRWLSGEDDPAFNGAIRDLWNPTCYGDPGRVLDEQFYHCSTSDSGGVHTNSGVPNHGFALLVDGGNYNGQSITGIGLTKSAAIYWRAMSVYQGPSSGFPEHADALEASCADLTGQPIYELTTSSATATVSAETITAADCGEVSKIISAVELREDPTFCGFEPLLETPAPAACSDLTLDPFFSEDFTVDPNWPMMNAGVFAEYSPRDWTHLLSLPDGRTGGLFAIDSINIGDCSPGNDDQSGVMYIDTPAMIVPAGSAAERMVVEFEHLAQTEATWDGGLVQYSLNGSGFAQVPSSAFLFNPYNGSLETAGGGNTNPLAGLPAYTGADGGKVVSSWGTSQINMTALGAATGDSVVLRFAFGVDGCNGNDGWYIDQIDAYMCAEPEPVIEIVPNSAESTQATDTTINGSITVSNAGGATLSCDYFDGTAWDQPLIGTSGLTSVYQADTATGAYSADDFTLSAATAIEEISVQGFFQSSPVNTLAGATALTWYIYADAGGTPAGMPNSGDGLETWTFTSAPTGAGISTNLGNVTLDLAAAGQSLTLPAGTYWLSFYPTVDFATFGEDYSWSQGALQGLDGQFMDQGLFTSVADGSWLATHTLLSTFSSFDYAFSIDGSLPNCTPPSDIPWLSLPDSCGPIPFGQSQALPVVFDSTGYPNGVYTATVCLLNNSANGQPYVSVPITMTVVAAEPAISVVKTVSTSPTGCGIDSAITVSPGATVYYCYSAENTGNATLSSHQLSDDLLGNILPAGFTYDLHPGQSTNTVAAGLVVTDTIDLITTNVATWTASTSGNIDASGTMTATAIAAYSPTSVSFTDIAGAATSGVVWAATATLGGLIALGALVVLRRRSQ